MLRIISPLLKKACLFFLLCLAFTVNAQVPGATVNEKFSEYAKSPREIVYVHLNKSTYIKGEVMAFNAYILDKNSKRLSTVTSNLYCVISDKNNTIVKEKLIKVTNGVAPGQFFADSLFTTGKYKFKAFTNYMRNFNEPNGYSQVINIIDAEEETEVKAEVITNRIDAQFLPEGGHMLADVQNTIGVIIKDSLGFGVPNVSGELMDANEEVISTFKTNELGIGKFAFIPENGMTYRSIVALNNSIQDFALPKADPNGIAMSLNDLGTRIAMTFRTNSTTLPDISNKKYHLIIHNGGTLKAIVLNFDETLEITKFIKYDDLSTGMNIITLFDDNDKPLLERLFFKYDGIQMLKSGPITYQKELDSLIVKLPIDGIDNTAFNNFSVSVLPAETKAYKQHHNILSSTFLQPYLGTPVENAGYYFTNVTRKKKYELDLLLLTQGWSSYDWFDVFNNPPELIFDFETGISINGTVNRKSTGNYLIYPTRHSKSNLFALNDAEKKFERTDFYLLSDEKIRIGEIQSSGKVNKPSLYLQFNPSRIPDFVYEKEALDVQGEKYLEYSESDTFKPSWENIEELDEVVVTADKGATKLEKLRRSANGTIDVFDDKKRKGYSDLASYLSTKGFQVYPNAGTLVILNKTPISFQGTRTPLVYLDGVLLASFSPLFNFQMNIVDYIEVNRSGVGEGLRGAAGVIKIYTDPSVNLIKQYGKTYQEYDVPLTFSASKKFYSPIYTSVQSDFFKEYGVLNWIPDLKTGSDGNVLFSIPDARQDKVRLFIEGITHKGQFLSEMREIDMNN